MIWAAFLLYAGVAVALGWSARRRQRQGVDFWTAGRDLGALSVGLSISAGFLSISWSCVYAVQLFYWYGLGAVWLITLPWLLALGGISFLARRYHALPSFSQPEMVGRRFGRGARRLVAVALGFVFLVWGGAEIYVAANLLGPDLGLSLDGTILLLSLTVGLYATLGGLRAVVNTDQLQYAAVVLYLVAMAWLTYRGLAGLGTGEGSGWKQMWSVFSSSEGPLEATKSGMPWHRLLAPGVATILLTFAAYLPGWLFETDLWLRVQAARTATAARRGLALAACNGLLFVGILPLFIGVSTLALFPLQGDSFPPEIGVEGDAIFAALVERFAPPWLGPLVAVGLVAAAMSTIDTCVNVVALSLAYDLLEVSRRRESWGRYAAPAATAGAVAGAALFALHTESLWDVFYLSSGVLTTAVAFPVAAVFLPGIGRRAVLYSAAAGLTVTMAAYFFESRGALDAVEPGWLRDTGVGFILWGLVAAGLGALWGHVVEKESPPLEDPAGP